MTLRLKFSTEKGVRMIDYFNNAQTEFPQVPSLLGIIFFVYSLSGMLLPEQSFSSIISLLFGCEISFLGSLFDSNSHCISTLYRSKHILLNINILQFSRACARVTYLEEKKEVGWNEPGQLLIPTADSPRLPFWYIIPFHMNKYLDFKAIKAIPIRVILQRLGINPKKEKGDNIWYLSPWRTESLPSLHVRQSTNTWIDFGEQMSGTDNIDLVVRLGIATTPYDAAMWINEHFLSPLGNTLLDESFSIKVSAPSQKSEGSQVVEIKPISKGKLATYFYECRRIPFSILSKFCVEVHYTTETQQVYYGAGIANIRGGYAVRNPMRKINVRPAGISLISGSRSTCLMFEGMTDFLSFVTLHPDNKDDKIILNSVELLNHAIPLLGDYHSIECYLDNDKAGKRATSRIQDAFGKIVVDKASVYNEYKDLNDYLKSLNK